MNKLAIVIALAVVLPVIFLVLVLSHLSSSPPQPVVHTGEVNGYYHRTISDQPQTTIYFVDGSKMEIKGHHDFKLDAEYRIVAMSGYIPLDLVSIGIISEKGP